MVIPVDRDFYDNIYGGTDYPDIERLLVRAGSIIDSIILTAPAGEYAPLSELQERQYSFAVCAQAEYIGFCGGIDSWYASFEGARFAGGSFSIGSFSMSGGSGSSGNSGNSYTAAGICSRAVSYLAKSGLLYRGCAARG